MAERTMQDEEILSRFLEGAKELQGLVKGLSEADLDSAGGDGGWTIRQIVHHVADDCDVWSMCIKKAIATPGVMVRFEGFPGNEAWAEALHFDRREIGAAADLIGAHRRYLARLLEHFADAWDRLLRLANAEGEVMREMSVREMVQMLTDHLQEHVERIAQILSERGKDRGMESKV